MIEFRDITRQTLRDFLRMSLSDFVAPNAVTVAEVAFDPSSSVAGIWDDDVAVGLVAWVDLAHPEAEFEEGDDPNGIYLWRLSIDAPHQRKGYGSAAIRHVADIGRALGRKTLYLTSVDAPGSGVPFYEKFGLVRTGRVIDGEVELCLPL